MMALISLHVMDTDNELMDPSGVKVSKIGDGISLLGEDPSVQHDEVSLAVLRLALTKDCMLQRSKRCGNQ